jgi:hypothetical protein
MAINYNYHYFTITTNIQYLPTSKQNLHLKTNWASTLFSLFTTITLTFELWRSRRSQLSFAIYFMYI